ncbi:MAG: glycosyltransferase [Ignavibacteria bacterium]
MKPKISVITTVYNCENYIKQSIESISNQSFVDFEYIIVDDGSTDGTLTAVQKLTVSDKRIILIRNKTNSGRVNSLNSALEIAQGEFIAMQDADDISLNDRLEKEFLFLKNNPGYVLVGSNIIVMDQNENFISKPDRPHIDLEAKFGLLFMCTFANPSIMYRKKIIDENNIKYEQNFNHVEDFRMITMISQYGKVFNLENTLVKYRKHGDNDSSKYFDIVNSRSIQVVKENLERLGINTNCEQVQRIRNLFSCRGVDKQFLHDDLETILYAVKEFKRQNNFEKNREIKKTLKRMIKWHGKRNIFKPSYIKLFFSILTSYNKELFLIKDSF